ncbi:hypothetical protein ACHQM5_010639 [Ranunculus cassubicifolius]
MHLLFRARYFSSTLENSKPETYRRIYDTTSEVERGSTVKGHVSIESEDETTLLAARMRADIPPIPSSQGYIFRVPERIRVAGEDTYDPRIISIGPYHHRKESLKAMEKYKQWYLDSFISRTKTSLADLVKTVKKLEKNARACYADPINFTSDEFVRMMILDGCFILELFHKSSQGKDVQSKDVVFTTTWLVSSIRRDFLLLENQIPCIILEGLVNLTYNPTGNNHSVCKLVTIFFNPILPRNLTFQSSSLKSNHLLDLLRNQLIPPRPTKYMEDSYWEYTHCATELCHAGVKFEKKDASRGLLDIRFTKDGVLEIPSFRFGVSWTILLPNLVALEQCRKDYDDRITSYVVLLDCLINSHSDVKLLRSAGIIDKLFKEDEDVALKINSLNKRVVGYQFYYDQLCKDVNKYGAQTWPAFRAKMTSQYFDTPWSVAKLATATILLILSILQTFPQLKGPFA